MNKDLNLKSLNFQVLAAKYLKRYGKHMGFVAVLVVLLVYASVVLKINDLAKAEPPPNEIESANTLVPKVNQQAINRIQSLENNNPQIHSLFEQARNNPFQE